jgi:uncharacterized protein YqhQ
VGAPSDTVTTTKNVGGQAIIEGVMMRGPEAMVMAVRRPDGKIAVRDGTWVPLVKRIPVLRWPFFRGSVVMVEALINGMQALSYSADVAAAEDEGRASDDGDSDDGETASGDAASGDAASGETKGGLGNGAIAMSLTVSMLIGVALFVYLPHFAAGVALNGLTGVPLLDDPSLDHPAFHLITGVIKITIFASYILAITAMKDIRRVFQYHGAEHKSIYTFEAGEDLTVENARKKSRLHPRCGTAFLAFVILVAILVYAGVFPLLPWLDNLEGWRRFAVGASIKLPLLLPIAGISYEFIRWAGKYSTNPVLKVLSWPGLMMQNLTTREPDDSQLEVALVSLIRTLEREGDVTDPSYPTCVILPKPEVT